MEKIVYVPGWMNRAEYDGFSPGLDIWGSRVDYKEKIDADVMVAHSLGCHFALLNWQENNNARLILVNPLLDKKGLIAIFVSWIKFSLTEGIRFANPKRLWLLAQFFKKLAMTYQFLNTDLQLIINQIPKDKIIILKGKDDKYLCNISRVDTDLKIIEIEGMGHVWKKEKIEPFLTIFN